MSDVDPLDVGMALAGLAFLGSLGSAFYDPLLLLALPLILVVAAFTLWAMCVSIRDIVRAIA